MFKLCILAILLAAVYAAPAPAPGALLAAPAIAAVPAPIVTASSSQYVARNYNTLAAAPLAAAPIAAAPIAAASIAAAPIAAAPLAAAAPFAAAAPVAAATPFTYAAAPLGYGTHAVAPAYTAAYSAPIFL